MARRQLCAKEHVFSCKMEGRCRLQNCRRQIKVNHPRSELDVILAGDLPHAKREVHSRTFLATHQPPAGLKRVAPAIAAIFAKLALVDQVCCCTLLSHCFKRVTDCSRLCCCHLETNKERSPSIDTFKYYNYLLSPTQSTIMSVDLDPPELGFRRKNQ